MNYLISKRVFWVKSSKYIIFLQGSLSELFSSSIFVFSVKGFYHGPNSPEPVGLFGSSKRSSPSNRQEKDIGKPSSGKLPYYYSKPSRKTNSKSHAHMKNESSWSKITQKVLTPQFFAKNEMTLQCWIIRCWLKKY